MATSDNTLSILKALSGGTSTAPFSAMAGLIQQPTQDDVQAQGLSSLAQSIPISQQGGAGSFIEGLLKGGLTGQAVQLQKKATSKREQQTQALMAQLNHVIQQDQYADQVAQHVRTLAASQQEALSTGPELTAALLEAHSTGDTQRFTNLVKTLPATQQLMVAESGAPRGSNLVSIVKNDLPTGTEYNPVFQTPDGKTYTAPQGYSYERLMQEFGKPYAQAQADQQMKESLDAAKLANIRAQTGKYNAEAKAAAKAGTSPTTDTGSANLAPLTSTALPESMTAGEKRAFDARQKLEGKQRGRNDVNTVLDDLTNKYQQLDGMGAIVNTDKGAIHNVLANIGSTGVAQEIQAAGGTKAQSVRQSIRNSLPLLMASIKNATGMSAQQMNSNAELKFYLQAATDPHRDLQSNLNAIENLRKMFAAPPSAGAGNTDAGNGTTAVPSVAASATEKLKAAGYSDAQIQQYLQAKGLQ